MTGNEIREYIRDVMTIIALVFALGAWVAFTYLQSHLKLNSRLEQAENNIRVIAAKAGLIK